MTDMNKGYSGYSMSNRAVEAYEDDQMPKSKWTKTAMIARIEDYAEYEDLSVPAHVYKMTKDQLFDVFFNYASWHHTSRFCNNTDFYKLDEERFENNLFSAPIFDATKCRALKKYRDEHNFYEQCRHREFLTAEDTVELGYQDLLDEEFDKFDAKWEAIIAKERDNEK